MVSSGQPQVPPIFCGSSQVGPQLPLPPGCLTLFTIIVLDEVKVDLANFDIKFLTKFLCSGFKKNLFLKKHLPNLFELLI
jgi:hypothetical protein